MDAMVLGEKRNIPWFVNNAMMKTGTVHILVVSGFNVGIVSFIIILFLKLIRVPRRIRFVIAIPCLVIYCLMTGASTPVVRATVMAIVFMLGFLLKREPDIYNSLSVACLFILIFNPRQLFDIGFQLSFTSVFAIVSIYPRLKSYLGIESLKIKYLRLLIDGCLVSFSAWLGTMGFIAYYFKIFSPITVLANLLIVPLATLITLCGFSLVFMSLIFPALASSFASASELLVALLIKINAFLARFPAAYFSLP
jgi:competence protein ComEC